MSAISIRDLWKEYDGHIVLERVNLEIAPRAFLALVGPSGCGKTTFLRLLLSEETPTRGVIEVDGSPITREPNADRGVVFQKYSVFPHLTVLENVLLGRELHARGMLGAFTGRLFGAARRTAIEEALELLSAVGLSAAFGKYPAQLSGGMQQRLALAQALIAKPKVLLLDEPFGALDPGIRNDVHILMRKLWHERSLTVVMVTHDLSEAFKLATRVVAFERRRNEPSDGGRYGAIVSQDFEVWPKRVAGAPRLPPKTKTADGDDPQLESRQRQDDPAKHGAAT
jgi:NitT/TauT family transport system ATP-binding protein